MSPGRGAPLPGERTPGASVRILKVVLVGLIRLYRAALAPLFAGACRFDPSCSRYAEEAIRLHGPVRGVLLAARRLVACRPFGRSGYDPVPEPVASEGRT